MANWTPQRSVTLSLLLDEVVGTADMVKTRQEYCKLYDYLTSCIETKAYYFTGSKSEGLDLPGSDLDYMFDINENFNIKVIQTVQNERNLPCQNILHLCTENVPIGFAMLRLDTHFHHSLLLCASQEINGALHLSNYILMHEVILRHIRLKNENETKSTFAIQGPSLEEWNEYADKSDSGIDNVPSIHCPFWPSGAEEWVQRPRHYDWPTPSDIANITNFGCHLVPIGHPLSPFKETEWRISFSVAERILVWSFNHVQLQCYAIMKLILKEFIKVNCSPQNNVLCSYFIKTFLFWKFEDTESTFWRQDNLRNCIKLLLVEFHRCIQEGIIKHYFFPRFNLLSIKLTREAQRELLQLLATVIQCDIGVFKECKTLQKVWTHFISTDGQDAISEMSNKNILRNDEFIMIYARQLYRILRNSNVEPQTLSFLNRTPLVSLILRYCMWMTNIQLSRPFSTNRDLHKLHRLAKNGISFDISSSKLIYAMVLLQKADYKACLETLNDVLSSIPPFAVYMSVDKIRSSNESKSLYRQVYNESDSDILERTRTSWLMDLHFTKNAFDNVPLAIHIELSICDPAQGVLLSPFTFAYYLMFLCYHELFQTRERDRTLSLLVDTLNNIEHCGAACYHSFNITGHCMLLAGERDRALEMFLMSYEITEGIPPFDKYNSARHYLQYVQKILLI